MNSLSLVQPERIARDPRKLAYLYPNMPVSRYKAQVDEYYRLTCLAALEQVAKMQNAKLIPASIIHHRRRDTARRITLFGRAYYVIDDDDLTDLEIEKYRQYVQLSL